MPRQKKIISLGRCLVKNFSDKDQKIYSDRHSLNLNDGKDYNRINLRSVTEQTKLDEFLTIAEMAGREFTAEREDFKIVSDVSNLGVISNSESDQLKHLHKKYQNVITIPRRPKWTADMSTSELNKLENESFLSWRRNLALFQEEKGLMLTPYERNLEFWRQLWRVIERSDVCLQILDCRNPLLFLSEDLQKYVKEVDSNKVNLVVLNKADFLTENQRKVWAEYFNKREIRAVFFSALQSLENEKNYIQNEESEKSEQKSENDIGFDSQENFQDNDQIFRQNCSKKIEDANMISTSSKSTDNINSHKIMNVDELIDYFKNIPLSKRIKEEYVTVGLMGYPNVGKSSTINALIRSKKVSVSSTPGKTKHFQTIFLQEDLCLCDCPGLVFPNFVLSKAEMILNGILSIDEMNDHVPPINLMIHLIPKRIFENTYSITLPDKGNLTAEQLVNAYGFMRGFMTQRGLPDNPRSARYLLKDFVNGKLLYCVAPPDKDQNEYHTFSEKERARPLHITRQQERLLNVNTIDEKKLNEDFFSKKESVVHIKSINRPLNLKNSYSNIMENTETLMGSVSSINCKVNPSKKHNNRNKRQKLRKKFAHLDVN